MEDWTRLVFSLKGVVRAGLLMEDCCAYLHLEGGSVTNRTSFLKLLGLFSLGGVGQTNRTSYGRLTGLLMEDWTYPNLLEFFIRSGGLGERGLV